MTRKIKKLLTSVLLVPVFFGMSGCTSQGESSHEHTYISSVVAPTCTEQGYTLYTCTSCGDSYKDNYVDAKGHTIVVDPAVPATESTTGLTEGSHCSVCGTVIQEQEVIPMLDHVHTYVGVVTDPTCTSQGYTTYTCSGCGASYVADYTDKLPHTIVIDEAVPATETTTGLTEGSHCSVCGEIIVAQQVIPMLTHEHDYVGVVTEPTCTSQGYTTYTCTGCGASYIDDYTDMVPHTPKVIEGYDATCTHSGLTDGEICEVCQTVLKDQEVIPALGHSFVDFHCDQCNDEEFTEDDTIGSLRIIARHDDDSNFIQGHVYLVYTNTTPSTVEFTIPNLYGSYTANGEYVALVNEDVTNMSWRVDQDKTAAEHLAIADSDFTYAEGDEGNTFTLQPGEYITIGGYNMADNNVYAALKAIKPLISKIDDENGTLSLLVDLYCNYILNGKLGEDDYSMMIAYLSSLIAGQMVNGNEETIITTLNTFLTSLTYMKTHDNLVSVEGIVSVLRPFVVQMVGGEENLSDINATYTAISSLYQNYTAGTLDAESAYSILDTYLRSILGETAYEEMTQTLSIAQQCYSDYQAGTLTMESLGSYVQQVVAVYADVLSEEQITLLNSGMQAIESLYGLYVEGNLNFQTGLQVANTFAESVFSEEQYTKLMGYEKDALEMFTAYQNGNLTKDMIVSKIETYLPQILGEDNYETIMQIYQGGLSLYQNYQAGSLTPELALQTLLPIAQRILGEETYNRIASAITAIKNLYTNYSENQLTAAFFTTAGTDLANLVGALCGEEWKTKIASSYNTILNTYSSYIQGTMTDKQLYRAINNVVVTLFPDYSDQIMDEFDKFADAMTNGTVDITNWLSILSYFAATYVTVPTMNDVWSYIDMLISGTSMGGVMVNRELYKQKEAYDQFPNAVYQVDNLSIKQMKRMIDYLGDNSYFSILTHNCSTIGVGAWNAAVGYDDNGEQTALYVNPSLSYMGGILDSPAATKQSVLALQYSEEATALGGHFVGSDLAIPAVQEYEGQYTLPDCTVAEAEEEEPVEEEHPAFHTATDDAIGRLAVITRYDPNDYTYWPHAFVMYTNTSTETQTFEFTCDMDFAYVPTDDFVQACQEDPTLWSYHNGNEEGSYSVAMSYFEEVEKIDGKYTVTVDPGECFTLAGFSHVSESELIRESLKVDQQYDDLSTLLKDFIEVMEMYKNGEISYELAKGQLALDIIFLVADLMEPYDEATKKAAGGLRLNDEIFTQKECVDQTPNYVYAVDVNQSQMDNLVAAANNNGGYELRKANCASFCAMLWNAAVGYDSYGEKTPFYLDLDSFSMNTIIDMPQSLYSQVEDMINSEEATAAGGIYIGKDVPIIYGGIVMNTDASEVPAN